MLDRLVFVSSRDHLLQRSTVSRLLFRRPPKPDLLDGRTVREKLREHSVARQEQQREERDDDGSHQHAGGELDAHLVNSRYEEVSLVFFFVESKHAQQ